MGPNWNEQAPMYDQLVFCELDDTRAFLDAAGVESGQTVLDVCCGPGRISVLAAERGCSVVGIDAAEKMLECARRNAEERGVADRCDFRLLDWDMALVGQNLERADVVIASRCRAMMDVEKLSALARERVMVQIFADAPSIPQLKNVLFDGCGKPFGPKPGEPMMMPPEGPAAGTAGAPGDAGGPAGRPGPGAPGGPGARPQGPRPRHLWPAEGASGWRAGSAFVDIFLKAYGKGYDPNVRIMPERFHKLFASEEEAVSWVCELSPERAEGNRDRVAHNVRPFLTAGEQGVEFCIATKAAIIWWDV